MAGFGSTGDSYLRNNDAYQREKNTDKYRNKSEGQALLEMLFGDELVNNKSVKVTGDVWSGTRDDLQIKDDTEALLAIYKRF